jgi:hypothetical protein
MTIFDTYLGDDVTNIHQVIHFNWAWNRTIDNFIDESLDFEEDKLYNYFRVYIRDVLFDTKQN